MDVLDSIFNGAFTLSTAAGGDIVNIESGSGGRTTVFAGAVALSTGAGNDTIQIGANTTTGHAVFLAGVKIEGGADSDVANVSAANFANIYPAGQPVLVGIETNA